MLRAQLLSPDHCVARHCAVEAQFDKFPIVKIALATPRVATSVDDALARIDRHIADAASQGAEIVCFPEAYLPGLRGLDFTVPEWTMATQTRAVATVAASASRHRIAVILGLEYLTQTGRRIASMVFDAHGATLGVQFKNQLDPSEEAGYEAGDDRSVYTVNGVTFGIAICHEAFRYPETVRWAAVRGAQIVFHPHCTGSDVAGAPPSRWLDPDGAYYEKAIMCRALENTIYFASVNYGFANQESATSIIAPDGSCVARQPYGEDGVLVYDADLSRATGLLASRLRTSV